MRREEYFRLHMDKRITNIVKPLDFPKAYTYNLKKEDFDATDSLLATHYDDKEFYQFPDLIFRPVFMFLDRLRECFEALMPTTKYHGVQYLAASDFDPANDPMKSDLLRPLYWIPYLYPQDVLHESTKINSVGRADNLALDRAALDALPSEICSLVRISLPGEEIYVVNYSTVEQLLGERALGMRFESVPIL